MVKILIPGSVQPFTVVYFSVNLDHLHIKDTIFIRNKKHFRQKKGASTLPTPYKETLKQEILKLYAFNNSGF